MRKHFKYLRKEKGLTLVELLAVLVILGIVAAIAIPLIGNIIQDSRDKATVNEALNIIAAAKLAHTNGEKSDVETDVQYSVSTLIDEKYLDIDGTKYQNVAVVNDGNNWKLININETIIKAVNNLASEGTVSTEVTERQLLKALEKEDITTN